MENGERCGLAVHGLMCELVLDQALMRPPSFMAVIHAGRFAARLDNGVFAIPLGCLRP